jgi:hypothetical protein
MIRASQKEAHRTISEFSSYITKLGGHSYFEDYYQKTAAIQVYERWGEGTFSAAFYVKDMSVFEREVAAFQEAWSRRIRFAVTVSRPDPAWTFWSTRRDEIERNAKDLNRRPASRKFGLG